MTLQQGIAFFLFALVAAVTPGPSNVMLTATGAVAGIRGGLPCLAGVSAGMGLLIFAVALGLGKIILVYPALLTALNWLGAAFLLWLAWRIASSGVVGGEAKGEPVGFVRATLFQWVNPKSWMASVSAVGTYLHADADAGLLQPLTFALVFVAASLPSGFVWLAFGASMHRLLTSARAARIFNTAMGGALAASIVMILW
jgi:threonine/homoserine/homoserine lactone efflux protein